MLKVVLIGISLLFTTGVYGQTSINFYVNEFDKAIVEAKKQNKDIFIDTYAPWCVPCKKMDKVFKNKKLASYYNEHFVNVKINVDRTDGKELATRYDIAFLPTMLIIDKNGNVKYRIDGLKSAQELLSIGDFAVNPQNYKALEPVPQNTLATSSDIKSESKSISTEDIKEEKILYVLDGSTTENPEILYQEAFFRIQNMDGSSQKVAQKYLDTQDDWSSEKNLKFIISFVNSTESKMFDYFVEQKEKFDSLMGPSEYRRTLEILVNRTLYRKIPRPDFERVEYLYSLLYPRKATRYTYQYMLARLEEEEKYGAFVDLGEEYLETLIKQDASLLFKLGKYKCINAKGSELKECIYRVEQSIKLTSEPTAEQYFVLSQLYLKTNKKKKALEYAEQAKIKTGDDNLLRAEIDAFLKRLEEL